MAVARAAGPYDAAKELGKAPREAMDLLIAYGLAERRPGGEAQHVASRELLPAQTGPVRRVIAGPNRRRFAGGVGWRSGPVC
jgi:hypothetical protein